MKKLVTTLLSAVILSVGFISTSAYAWYEGNDLPPHLDKSKSYSFGPWKFDKSRSYSYSSGPFPWQLISVCVYKRDIRVLKGGSYQWVDAQLRSQNVIGALSACP